MVKIDALGFLGKFASMQACKGGVGHSLTPKEIEVVSGLPRSTVYYHLKGLMARGFIRRCRYGHYQLAFSPMNACIGVSVITYWDVMEFSRYPDDFLNQFTGWEA